MRISSLPAFLTCPSSQLPTEHPYEPPSEVADLGTAVHEALAVHVAGQRPDLDAIAKKHHVDSDELEQLYVNGCIAWKDLCKYFPNAYTEQALKWDGIEGHADVSHYDESTMAILDWKSGRIRRDYSAQLIGYAAAAVEQFGMPKSGEVKVITVWLRDMEFEILTVTQDDMERLHHDIKRAELDIGKRYAPGDACGYCRRQLVCGARHEYLSSATSALMPIIDAPLSAEQLPKLYTKSKMLRKALADYDKALKIALADGPLSDGNGNMLELVETKRDRLVSREAWPLLKHAGFSDDDITECVSMSKTAVLSMAADKAPKGRKGKDKAALMEILRSGHAVTEVPSLTVKSRKI